MITGIAHVCYTTTDLDAASEFYCGQLGLRHAFDFVRPTGQRYGVFLHVGGREFVELFEGRLDPPAERQRYRHLCLEVDDIQAAAADLRAKGLEVEGPAAASDGGFNAWIHDPDGNRIELYQFTDASKQKPFFGEPA